MVAVAATFTKLVISKGLQFFADKTGHRRLEIRVLLKVGKINLDAMLLQTLKRSATDP